MFVTGRTVNSSEQPGLYVENFDWRHVKASIRAAKKKPTPVIVAFHDQRTERTGTGELRKRTDDDAIAYALGCGATHG